MYPFCTREYRALFSRHFSGGKISIDGNFEILPDNRAVLVGMKPVLNNQEVTDFGELSEGADINSIHSGLKSEGITTVQYDYIREDSTLYADLSKRSTAAPVQRETSPRIILPTSWEIYLDSLERTDRKELKRKLRRLETQPHSFHVNRTISESDFATFIHLHRISDTAKDQFMTEPMRLFFWDLVRLSIPGWSQTLATLTLNNTVAASVLLFENDEQVLLYNSGYDPEQKFYSVGLLLKAWIIKYAIESNKKVVDFLRGNERYKYDLGARDVKLYRFTVNL